jgi:hypothetical protein
MTRKTRLCCGRYYARGRSPRVVRRSRPLGWGCRERPPRAVLAGFQQRVTGAAHLQFGTWREGSHDDVLLAVALASWWGEHGSLEQHFW